MEEKEARKSVMVYESTKNRLQEIKDELKLSNESDVLTYLISLYEHSTHIPKQTQDKLIKLLK